MTVEFVPFEAGHLLQIEPQAAHRHLAGTFSAQDASALGMIGGWTGLRNGLPIGCGGIVPITSHRALAWALIGTPPPRAWLRIHRQAQRAIESAHANGFARIEMYVDADFPAARRWALLLGFAEEARLRRALTNLHDCLIMVKFK